MKEKTRREFTVEEKAAILAQYDHAATGAQRQSVLREHGIVEAYIVRFRKQLSRTIATSHVILTDAPKAKVVLKPKEVIEVSAEPDTDELIEQATNHIDQASRLINTCRSRIQEGMNGIVTKKYDAALISASDMLMLARIDLTSAKYCNEIR